MQLLCIRSDSKSNWSCATVGDGVNAAGMIAVSNNLLKAGWLKGLAGPRCSLSWA